jgi:hypothetical protein
VQFHCKEAEYLCWQEQLKMKHVEVQRVYAYFKRMNSVWLEMSEMKVEVGSVGGVAYARRTAGMWTQFGEKMTATLEDAGVPELWKIPAGTTFVDDGHKQITPFFFTILLILWLDPITGYLLDSGEGGI